TSLTSPLELLCVDNHKKPSLYSVRSALASPELIFNYDFVHAVDYFQEEMLEQHHELLRHVFPPKSENPASHQDPRWLENEHKIGPFFRAENFKRAKIIVKELHSGAKVFAVDGRPTNGTDMFLCVRTYNAAGSTVESNIVVEFKLPPGLDQVYWIPAPLPAAGPHEKLAFYTSFPSSRFELALQQAYTYACDRSRDPQGVSSVNPNYAFVSTFNGLWVLQMGSGSGGNDSSDSSNSSSNRNRIALSSCFLADNTTPHFKLLPGLNQVYWIPAPLSAAGSYEKLAFYASFPLSRFELALQQAYIYACDQSRYL
ncbi:hypothetical protein H4S08_004066, partial [Coemansia sp. RSA 1365]